MRIHIITGFPKLLEGPLNESILKRAQAKGLVQIIVHDLRDYTTDKHKQIDDYPYGGGAGMVLKPEPIFRCMDALVERWPEDARRVILMTPAGETFNQKKAQELSLNESLVLICGHYKGVDERVREALVTEEISIGDYVLTGGELAALVVVDAVVRLLPGVLGDFDSALTDSFTNDLLDCPYYTRPEEFRGMRVPEVLLSGHHAQIAAWRRQKSLERTRERRRDLWERAKEYLDVEETGG
jgi:tRNA (guanine37-N1)-methyltransferase